MNSDEDSTRSPMRRWGLVDQAAARLRDEVVSGRWPVGQRIPTEPALVAQFGIGRNTVREAVQSLVHAGLLRRDQGRGTFVISTSELTGTLERQLAGGSRRDYLELRLALDSTAAGLAAERRTAADVAMLRELCERRQNSGGSHDPDARAVADLALHRAVVDATHNPLYVTLYAGMLDVFAAHMRDDDSEDAQASHLRHRELVDAIADQDPDRASAAVAAIVDPYME